MARIVNIHEAKTHFSELAAAVERGEEIVIARRGKPVLKLVPVEETGQPRRTLGWAKDLFPEIEALANDPSLFEMTEEEIAEWYTPLGDEAELVELLEKPAT